MIASWLLAKLLAELESILIDDSPDIIEDIESLIKNLQDYISSKSILAGEIINPVLDVAHSLVDDIVPAVISKVSDEI